jgi:formate hydrogenlyase transcriptional activator
MITRSGSQDQKPTNIDANRCVVLVQLADLVIRHHNLQDLIRDLFGELRKIVSLEIATLSLHDRVNSHMHLHSWELASEKLVSRIFKPELSLSDWAWEHQEAMIVPDLRQEARGETPDLERIRKRGIVSYCVLPLTTAHGRLGVLGLGSSSLGAYTNDDLWFLKGVAGIVSIALENLTTRQVLRQQKQHIRTLVDINRTLVIGSDLSLIFPSIADLIRKVAPVDLASLTFTLEEAGDFQVVQAGSGGVAEIPEAALKNLSSVALNTGKTIFFRRSDPHARDLEAVSALLDRGLESGYCIPLATTKGARGTITFATTEDDGFDTAHVNLLQHVAVQVAIALDNAQSYREIAGLRDRLAEEKFYLEDEISADLSSSEIIGESQPLKHVLAQVKTVASKEATVLILGETGTGKELIARAVHRGSPRKDRSFIKVNCAAIPTGLLESELFGHEKGAFTGAITQKIGRLELADGGTLFLDEVGDIPLELQPKLLRVLQDQEFERLGSNRTLKVNIRLIAATNRKLAKLVQDKQFRSDLFYRLSVFPIHLPPLRERRADIPLLVRYFCKKYARRMDKVIDTIPTQTMKALKEWSWPGNVRELENFVERSVILSESNVFRSPLAELAVEPGNFEDEPTLEQAERRYIIKILQETRGVVAGPRGAAARLGLKRTTLQSRIRRLGIRPIDYDR